MNRGQRRRLRDKYAALLLPILILLSLRGYNQTYNATTGTTSNKPYAPAQAVPTDSRSMYYDATNFLWRPYQSTAEALAYLNLSKYRTGNFILVVDSGGTLQSNGTFIGGVNTFWMFKDGTADANLVKLNLLGSAGACSGCLLASNNLSDLPSASSGRANLGLGSMSVLNSTAGGDLSGTWPSVTVSFFNGQLPSYYLNYLNLTNKPAIPAQLNPTGAGLTTITGVYPNLTWTTTTPGLDAVLLSNNALAANRTINNGSFALRITGTGAFGLPNGNTSQRPATPSLGDEFYNTDTLTAEYWNGSAWTHPSGTGGGGGSGITALTGDVSASGTGSVVATLATVNSNVFASNTFLKFGVNGKGLVTSATAVVSGDIISALGYTPYNTTNPAGYIPLTALSMTNTGVNGLATYTNTTGIFNVPNYGADTTGANGLATLYQLSLKQGIVTLTTSGSGAPTLVANTLNIPTSTLAYTQNALNNTLANNAANTVTFLVADHSHAGLMDSASKAVVDSLRLRTYAFPTTLIGAVQGLHASVTGDSVLMGGFFFMPDTIATLGYGFAITGLPDEATLGAGDSVLVEKAGSKYLTLVPSSAIGGGGAVSSVSDDGRGTTTISPTTGAVLVGLNLANNNNWTGAQTMSNGLVMASNITFSGTTATRTIGSLANIASQVYTRNISSDGSLALSYATSAAFTLAQNGVAEASLLSTNQWDWYSYIGNVFPGTLTGGTPDSVVTINDGLLKKVPASAFGTVTSVAETVPSALLTISGSPITTSGTFALGLANQTSYTAFGNFTAGTTTPSFGKIPILALATNTANSLVGFDGSGNPIDITAGPNITISGGTISATGGGGSSGPAGAVQISGGSGTFTTMTNFTAANSIVSADTFSTHKSIFDSARMSLNTIPKWRRSSMILINNSYGVPTGPTVPDSGENQQFRDTMRLQQYNYSVGGTGVWWYATQFMSLVNGPWNANITWLGSPYNDLRVSSGTDQRTYNKAAAVYTAGFVNHFATKYIGGGDASTGHVTRFGSGWTTAQNATIYGGKMLSTAAIDNTANDSISYQFTIGPGSTVVAVSMIAGDGNIFVHSTILAKIDGILNRTIDLDSIADGFTVNSHADTRVPYGIIISGLSNGVHTLTLVNTQAHFMYVDYFTTLDANRASYIVEHNIIPPTVTLNSTYPIKMNVVIDSVFATFPSGYPAFVIPINDYAKDALGIFIADSVHLNNKGCKLAMQSAVHACDSLSSNAAGIILDGGDNIWISSGTGGMNRLSTFNDVVSKGDNLANLNGSINVPYLYSIQSNNQNLLWTDSINYNLRLGPTGGIAWTFGTGQYNTFGGVEAGWHTTLYYNTAFGARAGRGQVNMTGQQNSWFGAFAGRDNGNGLDNSGFGYNNQVFQNGGSNNTTMGANGATGSNGASNFSYVSEFGASDLTAITTGQKVMALGAFNGDSCTTCSNVDVIGSYGVELPSKTISNWGTWRHIITITNLPSTSEQVAPTTGAVGIMKDFPAWGMDIATSIGVKVDSLPYVSSTTATMLALIIDTTGATHNPQIKQIPVSALTGTTPTLQQVLTAGSTLTGANTIALGGNTLTISGGQHILGNASATNTWNPGAAIPGGIFNEQIGTLNDAITAASGTVSNAYVTGITTPTLTATNAGVTYTNAFTFWINQAPVAGTNVTITNTYALGVTGNSLFNGTITSGAVNLTGSNDLTGQTGATTITSYAVPGSTTFNTFRVGGYITVTAVSLDVIQLQVTWTDETSTSRTQSFFVQGATTGISTTGANAYSPIDIRVKKGTTITVATILTTGTGSITYDAGATITQLY